MDETDLPQFDDYEEFLKTSLNDYGDVDKKTADVIISKKIIEVKKLLTAVHHRAWPDADEPEMSLMTSYSLMDRIMRDITNGDADAQKQFIKEYLRDQVDAENPEDNLLRTSEPEEIKELFGGHINGN